MKTAARRILVLLLMGLALLILTLAANTLGKQSRQIDVAPAARVQVDREAAAERLAAAVRIRTITYDDRPNASAAEFLKLHAHLRQSFPQAHKVMKREVVAGYSLLYTWPGKDPDAKPIMVMAH